MIHMTWKQTLGGDRFLLKLEGLNLTFGIKKTKKTCVFVTNQWVLFMGKACDQIPLERCLKHSKTTFIEPRAGLQNVHTSWALKNYIFSKKLLAY